MALGTTTTMAHLVRACFISTRRQRNPFGPAFKLRGGGERQPSLLSQHNVTSFAYSSSTAAVATPHPPNCNHTLDDSDAHPELPYRVYLAVGSNLGNRFENIRQALHLLCQPDDGGDDDNHQQHDDHHHQSTTTTLSPRTHVVQTSFLHETAPMYVTDQPAFLNGAVQLATNLPPHALLRRLKGIEAKLGRRLSSTDNNNNNNNDTPPPVRNGPRPVDLDILFYETRVETGGQWFRREIIIGSDNESTATANNNNDTTTPNLELIIPHPRISERNFVLQPLLEVAGPAFVHPVLNATIGELHQRLRQQSPANDDAVRVLPLPRNRFLYWNRTLVMGILNVTPDSFSDGGHYHQAVQSAAQHALRMVRHDGAAVVDVGGESTRPGAAPVTLDQEMERVVPVIQRIRALADETGVDVVISIDTRRAAVARAAVEAGADLVNDVSGGSYDPEMLSTVASLGVPVVLMHMRGTPETMQSMTDYPNVVQDVADALAHTSRRASQAGIPRWLQIVDPGIGFAKDIKGNLSLLRNLTKIREATGGLPLLIGTSRKGFLGTLTGVSVAADRDYATVASCVAALCLEDAQLAPAGGVTPTMLRVHNPAAMVQGVKVVEAIQRSNS